ncbi:hypothetical protein QIT93_05665 [Clostridium baratii]|uniref:hypothetical protein n=1 Tax=Clostridium baratii TaxID=1561 RepID=UPI001CAB2E53|nr:hypothetical protein [Clostridium baratii]STA99356.1 Uncharacterised protein [Clostridium baratii]
MKFEFTSSKYADSSIEFMRYFNKVWNTNKLYNACIKIPYLVGACIVFIAYLCADFDYFFDKLIYLITFGIVIFSAIYFILKKCIPNKKVIKNFYKYNSKFYFTIKEDYLIKESRYSTINIKLNKIHKIEILKKSLILFSEDNTTIIFIPKECLPVSLNEFINLFRQNNKSLIVNDYIKTYKKYLKKVTVVISLAMILTVITGYFLGKYIDENNFKVYDLKLENELKKEANGEAIYESRNLGINIYLPSNWSGKYGIEELNDRINVYYLPEGVQSSKTTLIFTLTKSQDFYEKDMILSRLIENLNKEYKVFRPEIIDTLKPGSLAYVEYCSMIRDISKIQIKGI